MPNLKSSERLFIFLLLVTFSNLLQFVDSRFGILQAACLSMDHTKVIVHLMRHEEAQHRVKYESREQRHSIRDPDLTAKGRRYCHKFSQNFSSFSEYISHLWCSPMKRTINTTLLAFKDVIDRGVKVQAIDLLQNWDSCPNGIGMDKEDLRAHFGEQVDFDKVGDGWNNKSSGMWASENQEWKIPALKWKLGGLQSATDRIEVVIVSHGSTLDSLTGVHQTWGNGRIRSYLIDDCGQLISRLDENTLKEYRSHGTDNHMILASDCDSSDNLEHSELAAKPNLEVSKYFGPTSSVQTNCPNKTITEGISMNNTDGTVETAKQTQSSFIALVKLFRVETPATKFEWVVSKKVEARVTDTLEIISTVCQDRNTSLMIWLMYDCSLPRQLVMKKQVWLKVMIANPMGEKDQILGEDNGTAGWEVVVAVKL